MIGAKPELVEGGEVDGKDERDQPRICFTFSKRSKRLVGMINDYKDYNGKKLQNIKENEMNEV